MSTIKNNFIFNIVLNISNIAFPIITIPYVSRILGVEQIGVFNFVATYTSYFVLVSALGIPLYGIREVSKIRDDKDLLQKFFSEIFTLNFISVLLISFLYVFSIYMFDKLLEIKLYLLVYGITLFLSFLNIDWFFSGREKFKIITVRSLSVKLLSLVLLFLFVKDRNDLLLYLLLNVLAVVGNQIWNVSFLKRNSVIIRFRVKGLNLHIKSLILLLFSTISIQIYLLIDTMMLGFMKDYYAVGIYSSAVKASRIVLPIVTSLGVVLLPRLAYYSVGSGVEFKNLLTRSLNLVFFFSIPLVVYFYLISDSFVPLFFGNEYSDAISPMKIVSLNIILSNLSYFFAVQILAVLSKEKYFLMATFSGLVINVLLNLYLIPNYSYLGSAFASVIAELTVTIVAFFFSTKVVNLQIDFKSICKYLIASIVFVISYGILRKIVKADFEFLLIYTFVSWSAYLFISIFIIKEQNTREIYSKLKTKILMK